MPCSYSVTAACKFVLLMYIGLTRGPWLNARRRQASAPPARARVQGRRVRFNPGLGARRCQAGALRVRARGVKPLGGWRSVPFSSSYAPAAGLPCPPPEAAGAQQRRVGFTRAALSPRGGLSFFFFSNYSPNHSTTDYGFRINPM